MQELQIYLQCAELFLQLLHIGIQRWLYTLALLLRAVHGGGLLLKICPRVHFKSVVVDGAWAYFGSANFTGAGLGAKSEGRRNFELGLCTEDFETIDRISALFEAVWSGAECATCKLRKVCPDPIGPEPPARSMIRLGHARRLRRN